LDLRLSVPFTKFKTDLFHPKTLDKQPALFFAVIVSSTLKAGADFYYDYLIAPAQLSGTTPWGSSVQTGVSGTFAARSISEMGNQGAYYSFGVPVAHVPAGFSPKAIPNGTPVLCFPITDDQGLFLYIILNTQAISGTC
jgi:hypothetical protein